jgi:hypothetical protein
MKNHDLKTLSTFLEKEKIGRRIKGIGFLRLLIYL